MQCTKWKRAGEDEQLRTKARLRSLFLSHVPNVNPNVTSFHMSPISGSQAAQRFQAKLKETSVGQIKTQF